MKILAKLARLFRRKPKRKPRQHYSHLQDYLHSGGHQTRCGKMIHHSGPFTTFVSIKGVTCPKCIELHAKDAKKEEV